MECIVPGCHREAGNNLGIRLRRPDTSALWAPNSEAFVCDTHAVSGARVTVFYEATETGNIEVDVRGTTSEAARVTPIRQEIERADSLADDLTARLNN